jgi:branched-chain amino acid transport system ATP-binding protein
MKALELRQISKHFGNLVAVNSVSLDVERGERLALIGPNGAGKTTLLNLIGGVLPISEGRIFFFGNDITEKPAYERAKLDVGRTFQVVELFQQLTVRQNVALVRGKNKRNLLFQSADMNLSSGGPLKKEDVLDSFGLAGKLDVSVSDLSHGDQRLLDIALALLQEPRLLLLDEPTAGLSAAESRVMLDLIGGFPPGITIILVEHDMEVVFEIADRIVVLHYGEKIADGNKEEVRADPKVREVYLGR